VFCNAAQAQELACRFNVVGTGKVARILDGRSFALDDGREVRLAGIEVPPPALDAADSARNALESMLSERAVALRNERAAQDRYGRLLAYVDIVTEGPSVAVAHAMIGSGHARVTADVGNTACAAELLSRERVARAAKLGLWGDPGYVVRGAERYQDLLAERGHFTVVEGKVLSVRESGGTIYMNFGRRWSQALTVTISKRHERMFAGAGVQPKRLANRLVRVRGWIDERNGPRIEATRPEQIEIAELDR
jgi:endonuclease YncB( thermonuclease family)